MDVLDALEATAYLAGTAPAETATLLVELGKVPGVDRSRITLTASGVRPGGHGTVAATWTQDGRSHTTEGHTPEVALRRALRRSEQVSAKAGVR